MSYTVWLKIENDEGRPNDDDEGWCQIGTGETRREALDTADSARVLLTRMGFSVSDPL